MITTREVLPSKLQNDIDPDLQDHDDELNHKANKRQWFWSGRLDDADDASKKMKKKSIIEEHPLRTDTYDLHVTWFPVVGRQSLLPNKSNNHKSLRQSKKLRVEFHRNGHCRMSYASNKAVVGIGTWNVKPWGVWFSIPCDGYEYTFTAGLHLNPFGKQPKFMQGSIVRKSPSAFDNEQDPTFVKKPKKQWFRPVVGTFSGVGVGIDTMDLSYADRGYGLSQ